MKTSEGTVTIAVDQPAVSFEEPETTEATEAESQTQAGSAAPLNESSSVVLVGPPQTDADAGPVESETEPGNVPATDLEVVGGDVEGNEEALSDLEEGGDEEYVPSENEAEDKLLETPDELEPEKQEEEEAPPPAREPREMGVGKRRYDCTQCSKTFNKAGLLREHIRAHAG